MLSLLEAAQSAIHATSSFATQFAVDMLWGGLHMLIHEVGHVLAARAVGCQIKQVGISKLGPYVRRTSAKTPLGNASVALAGPGINILTSVVFYVFGFPYAWIPMFIGVLNLLPIPNSDLSKSIQYLRKQKSRNSSAPSPSYLD